MVMLTIDFVDRLLNLAARGSTARVRVVLHDPGMSQNFGQRHTVIWLLLEQLHRFAKSSAVRSRVQLSSETLTARTKSADSGLK